MLNTFNKLWILDLHGNIKKRETVTDGVADENIFDIQQGVAIFTAMRRPTGKQQVYKSDVFGARLRKYDLFNANSARTVAWEDVRPASPFYVFIDQDDQVRAEYLPWPSIKQIMPVNVLGFQTHRDHFAIAFNKNEIVCRCESLRNESFGDEKIRQLFKIKDNRDWSIHEARYAIQGDMSWEKHVARCLYRPFDTRWCYFSSIMMDYPRRELLDHIAGKDNLCLLVPRQISFLPWRHAGVSDTVAESCLISTKTKKNYNFSLYIYVERDVVNIGSEKRPNFSTTFLKSLSESLHMPQQKPHLLPAGISPEDIFYYAYAVFHSPKYRIR